MLTESMPMLKISVLSILVLASLSLISGAGLLIGLKLGLILFLFFILPGYLLSIILIPEKIDFLECIVYSLGLGFVLLPFILYYVSQAGFTLDRATITTVLVFAYGILIFLANKRIRKNYKEPANIDKKDE